MMDVPCEPCNETGYVIKEEHAPITTPDETPEKKKTSRKPKEKLNA